MPNSSQLSRAIRAAATTIALTMLGAAIPAGAVPLTNPDPSTFLDDLDGTGLFDPTSPTFAVELVDVAGDAGPGAEFGFYFAGADLNDPANLITIFGVDDQGANAEALIDFTAGAVVDTDDGNSLQSIFTPMGGPIGFYLTLAGTTLFSESSQNIGGVDLMGTFPVQADPTLLVLGFAVPAATTAGVDYVAFELLANVQPVKAPAPAALSLMAIGVMVVVAVRRRKAHA